jgi:bifunctional UDP-N-acetylglucosamine pyrophosphorylase / glucosamine-1-phosphate N-acetyltransferase
MMQPIILAAGKGTRMASELPKTLCKVAGRPMLSYILDALSAAGNCFPPIIVIGHKGEQIKQFVGNALTTVEQSDLSGTGTATKIALPEVPEEATKVFIMYGDHPFITPQSIKAIEEKHDTTRATITLATATVQDFNDWRRVFVSFGRVIRNQAGAVQEIREYKNANEHEQGIPEINPGFYCVDKKWLIGALDQVERDSVSGEYYLTDIVSLALYEGKLVETISIGPREALGINSPQDVAEAESLAAFA